MTHRWKQTALAIGVGMMAALGFVAVFAGATNTPIACTVMGVELFGWDPALLLGLVLYTSAFVAEIVRSGIQSVSRGQAEAAAALGLGQGQTMQLVMLPQALREERQARSKPSSTCSAGCPLTARARAGSFQFQELSLPYFGALLRRT